MQVEAEAPITRAYGYDDVDQVTSEVLTQAGVTLQSTGYGFDGMGNRTQVQSTSTADQSTSSHSHNRLNQTTGLSTTTAQGTIQSTLRYDDEGNLIHVGATAQSGTFYTYDDANQLSQIVNRDATGEPTSKSTFLYDGVKRLRVSRDFSWQNNAWVQTSEVRRVYDGMNVVQERDAQNNVLTTYTRGLDMSGGIGGLLARTDGNGSLFYHYDGRGNVTQLTNSTQQVVAKYGYDAFGNTSASGTAAGLNRYRFSTKEQIGGLYCYGYRFYSASLGRWINRDPIGESGGVNLYGFVENNSTNKADVYGMFPWWLEGVLAGIAVAAEAAMGFCGSLMCRENCETCCHIALAVYGAALFAAYMVAIVGCGVMVVAPPVAGACVALATLVYAGTLWNMANDYQGCLNSCRNKPSRGTPPCCP